MSEAKNMVDAIERLVDEKIAKAKRGGPSTVPAEYMGEDSEGKAWVVLAGAGSMTPVRRSSVEASVGDTVSVTVSDGMAVIDANLSDKSAGMKSVAVAKETAVEAIDYATQASAAASSAQSSASSALQSAGIAQASADSAVADAARANEAATQAISDAADASVAADSARDSANKATYALSDVERVVGTVNWIAEHGEYLPTEDVAVDASKVYYTRSGGENLFDRSTCTEGYYINVSGGFSRDAPSMYTALIPVTAGQSYTVHAVCSPETGGNKRFHGYDSNGTWVRQLASVNATAGSPYTSKFTIPNDVESVRLSMRILDTDIWFGPTNSEDYVYTVVADPVDSELPTYFELHVDESIQNFINAHVWLAQDGLYVGTQGSDYKARIDADSLDILDDTGAVVATFGEAAQIGKSGESRLELDYHSMQMVDKDAVSYFDVRDLRGTDGKATTVETFDASGRIYNLAFVASEINSCTVGGAAASYSTETIQQTPPFTRVMLDTAPQDGTVVEISYKTESGYAKAYTLGTRAANSAEGAMSYAEGNKATASGYVSHAEGDRTRATGRASHAEGVLTEASGGWSHAEGSWAYAKGSCSHAEGSSTRAAGQASHAEGYNSRALGGMSHAEGAFAKAAGNSSHAQNIATIAEGSAQTAIGRYNLVDLNDRYALIIGNGGEYIGEDFVDPAHPDYDYESEYTHSNALTVDWGGGVSIWSGNIEDGSVPSANADGSGRISLLDSKGAEIGYAGPRFFSDGRQWYDIGARRVVNGSTVSNGLSLGISENGTRYVSLNREPWLSALGFNDSAWTTQDDSGPSVSVANSTWVKLTTITLTAGHWLALVGAYAAANNTGRRCFALTSASSVTASRLGAEYQAAVPGAGTYTVIPYLLKPTATTTYNIFGWQNSGSALSMSALVRSVHLYTA